MSEQFHPVANAWPLIPDVELDDLADDIAAHGLHYAIWRHRDGRIIDGRNRWLACQKAGVECPSNTYQGEDGAELVAFVVAMNDRRRHLTESQRAMVAANLANLDHGGDRSKTSIDVLNAVTQADAAKLMNVSVPSVQRAKVVKNSGDDEIIKAVESGQMSVSAAANKLKKASTPKPQEAPTSRRKTQSKTVLSVVQAPRPQHVIQFSNLLRSLGMIIDDFADASEAASLCARFDANIDDDAVWEIIEFLEAFRRARKAGQAA